MPAAPRALGALHELRPAPSTPTGPCSPHGKDDDLLREDQRQSSASFSALQALTRRSSGGGKIPNAPTSSASPASTPAKSSTLASLRHVVLLRLLRLDQNQIDLLREVRRRVPCTVVFPFLDTPATPTRSRSPEILLPLAENVRRLPEPPPPSRVAQLSTSGARARCGPPRRRSALFADRGIGFGEIGVVARTLDPYLDADRDAVPRAPHPFHLQRDPSAVATIPRVKAARCLFSSTTSTARTSSISCARRSSRTAGAPTACSGSRFEVDGHRPGGRRMAQAPRRRRGEDWVHEQGRRAGGTPFVLRARRSTCSGRHPGSARRPGAARGRVEGVLRLGARPAPPLPRARRAYHEGAIPETRGARGLRARGSG